ncbi:unnamed protein product [Tetraodon nigroviridis]|uniref:(spotted green pufferfish) hypothetical protein n=1 Tax=Tetraodon nigroviridis TaxID=99883 RepID=Q4THH7_TETNG|nr:unnamed protein product [Tetraodon nigroviridis]
MVQQEPPFPPEMSPTSPLLSPQKSTSQTPLLQQAPAPGYQSSDTKSWQQTGITSNSLFSQPGQGAGQAFGQQGVYNNMSITVSMAGGSGGVSSLPPMGQPVAMSTSNLSNVSSVCSDQQVGHSDSRVVRFRSAFISHIFVVCVCVFFFVRVRVCLPAGASVCRCPVHGEPGRERLVHQPGLRRNRGLAEGPPERRALRTTRPSKRASSSSCSPSDAPLPSPDLNFFFCSASSELVPLRLCVTLSDGRMSGGGPVGSGRFGCRCYACLFGEGEGGLSWAACSQPTT